MNSKTETKAYSSKLVLTYVKNAELFWVVAFSLLLAVSAQISIPVLPVPFTLQTLVVLLAGATLGAINGALSVSFYLLMGVFGLPVFANFSGGLPHLFGPTGGYLLAFPIAAFLVGTAAEKKGGFVTLLLSMLSAVALILFFGAFYLSYFTGNNIREAFIIGAQSFTVWEIAKIAAALGIYYSVPKKYRKLP